MDGSHDSVDVPDPYTILGVTAATSNDDLDAFRGLVRQLHPDTRTPSESDAEADQRLQEILTAYATLRDPILRAAHDAPAPNQQRPQQRAAAAASRPGRAADLHADPGRSGDRIGPVNWEPPPQAALPAARGAAARAARDAATMASADDIETYSENGVWKTRWRHSTYPFAAGGGKDRQVSQGTTVACCYGVDHIITNPTARSPNTTPSPPPRREPS